MDWALKGTIVAIVEKNSLKSNPHSDCTVHAEWSPKIGEQQSVKANKPGEIDDFGDFLTFRLTVLTYYLLFFSQASERVGFLNPRI